MTKKHIVVLLAAAIVIGVGYWLISPLFIDREVNDDLSPELESAVEEAIEDFRSNIDEQVAAGDMDAFMDMMKEADGKDDVVVEDTMPAPGPTVLKAGSFASVAHQGSGEVKMIDLGAENGSIIRFVDLDVDNGPDLRVLLSKNANVRKSSDLGDYIELAKLKGNKGTQNYAIPAWVDPAEYSSVVIYCKPFHVVFNSAELFGSLSQAPQPLLGGWLVEEADASFDSITFLADGTYHTHLNERPFDSGNWSYDGNTLALQSEIDTVFSETYENVTIDGGTLVGANNGVAFILNRVE